MKRLTKTGSIIAGATAAALLLGGGIAVAYWTSSGTGTGSAAAGTAASVTVTQSGTVTGLYPDGPAQTITVVVANPNDAAVNLAGVTAAVSGTDQAGCTAADFEISGPAYAGGTVSGNGSVTSSAATIRMINDVGRNQDACKGATVALAFTATAAS